MNFYVYGDITGQDNLTVTDGEIIYISESDFENYIKGVYAIAFNANGGQVDTEEMTVFYGSAFGTLPTPTRDYYTFDQLSKLGAVARTRNLTLVLELTPYLCERFEAAVGHTALSLEGESVMVSLVNEMLAAVSDVVVRLRVPQSRYTEKLAKLKNKRFELILE